jgi:potassium inwardly-rectifying channel subfamily J
VDSADSTPSLCSPHTLRPDDARLASAAAAFTPASHRSMNSLYDATSRRPSRQSNRSSLRSPVSHEKITINKASSLPDISCHSPQWDVEAGEEDGEHCATVIGPETEMVYKTLTRKLMFLDVARKGRLFNQRTRERLIYKSGESNISNANVHQRRFRYIVDIFTTLLELSWGYSILLYTLSFFISWCTFALCWWAISSYYISSRGKDECVLGVKEFTSALLFSIETQQTIGYGTRAVTTTCPVAIIVMMLQSVFGVVLECIMTGLIFAKLALPKRRAETIMFSKTAVICMHKGNLCLVFRVGDMRKCHMIDVNVNSVMVKQRKKNAGKNAGKESDETPLRQYKLDLEAESEDFFFLAWPIHVIHKITENSPLWDMTPEKLLVADFEIIVVLEGIIESSGMTTQVRTSYLPSEIMWGHKLATLLTYQKDNGQYKIDYTQFHTVVPVDTPDMSAKDLAELNSYRAKGRRVSVRNSLHPMLPHFRPQVSMVCETEED